MNSNVELEIVFDTRINRSMFITPPTLEVSLISDITSISIGTHGVKSLLDYLDSHKATGPDNIPTYMFIETT